MNTDTENMIVKKITVDDVEIQMAGITPTGMIVINDNGTYDVTDKAVASVEVEKGVFPAGTLDIKDNGEYDVTHVMSVRVNVGNKELTVILPSEFGKATRLYYFQVTDDKILFSTNLSSDFGVWIYSISGNDWEQKYSLHGNYSNFKIMGTKCFIFNNDASQYSLVYDPETNTIKQLTDVGESSSSPGYRGPTSLQVADNKWILQSESTKGILLYNSTTQTFSKIITTGTSWRFKQITDTKVLAGRGDSSLKGVYLIDLANDTIKQIYTTGTSWDSFHVTGTKCLISGNSGTGLLLYNSIDDSISLIYSTGRYTLSQVINEKILLSSVSSSYTGILMYNSTDDTVTKIYTTGYYWSHFHVIGDKCLISSQNSSTNNKGLLLYNSIDDTITQVYTDGYAWDNSQIIGENMLISSLVSTTSYGVLLYNSIDDTITKLSSSSNGYVFYPVENNCISYTPKTEGVFLYNSTDNTLTKIFSYGYYDVVSVENEICYISNSDKSSSRNILRYNNSDNSIKIVSYYIGEV